MIATSDPSPVLERIDRKTGKARWHVPLDKLAGELEVVTGDGRVFVSAASDRKDGKDGEDQTIAAIDPRTGRVLWTTTASLRWPSHSPDLRAVVAHGDLIEGVGLELHVLDGATGSTTVVPLAVHEMRATHDRLFIVPNGKSGYDELVALDLSTRKQVWSKSIVGLRLIGADDHAVYFVDDMFILRAIDAATGTHELWTYGVGKSVTVELWSGYPQFTWCTGNKLTALDPSAPEEKPHTVTVTGRVTCKDCNKNRLRVRVGNATVTSDHKGKFTITATGRGSLRLEVELKPDWWQYHNDIPMQADTTLDVGSFKLKLPEEQG
jgi:outer membrane protein assembly factor BamB